MTRATTTSPPTTRGWTSVGLSGVGLPGTGFLALALGILSATGCEAPLDSVDFCVITARPGTTVDDRAITLPLGTVVALKASPVDTHGDIMDDDTRMDLESGNPGVLGAARLDHESKSCPGAKDVNWYFALWGVEPGQTTLKVWVNSRIWREIPVNVTGP